MGTVSQTAFNVYAALLWRLSRPVVRGWEFDADAFAGRVTAPGIMARALVKLDLAQMRFEHFRRNWLDAVLGSGYLPPVMRGFWEYYDECALDERNYRRLITAREVNRESETHPPLRERVLRLSSNGSFPGIDRSAFDLVRDFETVETQLYANRPDAMFCICSRAARRRLATIRGSPANADRISCVLNSSMSQQRRNELIGFVRLLIAVSSGFCVICCHLGPSATSVRV